jgi:plastocyanin
MHFSKLTIASLVALLASVSSVSATPADGAYAGGFPAGGYGNPAPVANAAAPAPGAVATPAPAAGAPAPAASSAPAAGVPVASPAPVTPPVGTLPAPAPGAPAAGVPAAATGKVFTVMVGNGNLTFVPKNFIASVGDTVSFVWTVGNHSVVQSTKADLCTKKGPDAFASGVRAPPFTWNITVNSTDPLWYYCGVPTHCQKGMYGAVNFPLEQQFPTPSSSGGAAGNATGGNGTTADAPKTNAAPSLTSMSSSALLAGALALGAFLL